MVITFATSMEANTITSAVLVAKRLGMGINESWNLSSVDILWWSMGNPLLRYYRLDDNTDPARFYYLLFEWREKAKIEEKVGLSKVKNTDKPQETAKPNSSQGYEAPMPVPKRHVETGKLRMSLCNRNKNDP